MLKFEGELSNSDDDYVELLGSSEIVNTVDHGHMVIHWLKHPEYGNLMVIESPFGLPVVMTV